MGTDWWGRWAWWFLLAAVGFAGGYLLATRRRSRLASAVGLCGVGLAGLNVAEGLTGMGVGSVLGATGVSPRLRASFVLWSNSVRWAAVYGLLLWTVVTDRPPATTTDDLAGE